jgi:hypothetical protein
MQIECSEHQQLLAFFCSNPSCQTYLCKDCRNKHTNHGILNAKEFADYTLKKLKRRENGINSILYGMEDSEQTSRSTIITCAQGITQSTIQLLDYIKEATESVFKKSEEALRDILRNIKEPNKGYSITEFAEEKERLEEMKSELIMAKKSEHFLAVQQIWEKLKLRTSVENVSNRFKELFEVLEEIKRVTKNLIKKLNEINDMAYRSLSDLKRSSAASSIPEVCSVCGSNKPIYLIQKCSHGICFDCAQEEIYEKISNKGLKVIDKEVECKMCGFEGSVIYVRHQECGCMINTKNYSGVPYYWDKNSKKFEWPTCKQGKYLSQEDIFFIYGGSGFTFLDELLPLEEFTDIIQSNKNYKYMTLCRELRKEDIESINKLLSNTEVEHIIWRGQRPQVLMSGLISILECNKKLKTINLSTNSLGDTSIKQLNLLYSLFNNIRVLDLCKHEYIINSKQFHRK